MSVIGTTFRAVGKTVTFPFRKPVTFVGLAAVTAVASSCLFGPMATYNGAAAMVGGVTRVVSAAPDAVAGIHNYLYCPGVVKEAATHNLTRELADKIAKCAPYFPSGAN